MGFPTGLQPAKSVQAHARVAGKVRIARFHLVDNTRGEPPSWKEEI
jgi:hypothetical protein